MSPRGWQSLLPAPVTIHPWSIDACGAPLLGAASVLASGGSTVWPVANLAIFVPFALATPLTIAQLFTANGATVSGNIDVGVYTLDGTRIVSAGSTAHAGTNTLQTYNIADTLLPAGDYYLAIAMNNTTGTLSAHALAAIHLNRLGIAQMATAFPLPATATLAQMASAYLPLFGLTTRTTI